MEKELVNVLNNQFQTSFEIDNNKSTDMKMNFESDSAYIHFTKALYKSDDLDTVRISIKDLNFVKNQCLNDRYIVFSFEDKMAYHKIINGSKYSTHPVGKYDRYFIEFGDHYFVPTSDLIYF